jgi:hypothetical protein
VIGEEIIVRDELAGLSVCLSEPSPFCSFRLLGVIGSSCSNENRSVAARSVRFSFLRIYCESRNQMV